MVDIVVTGVGSYDVSIAAHLRQKLLSFLVFGPPMASRRAKQTFVAWPTNACLGAFDNASSYSQRARVPCEMLLSMPDRVLLNPELREQDADMTVRPRRSIWGLIPAKAHAPKSEGLASRYIRRPIFWLGPSWKTWFWSAAPGAFGRLPARTRNAKACSTRGTGGPAWARHRAGWLIPVAHGLISKARGREGEVVLNVRGPGGHANPAVGRLAAATGYNADVCRRGPVDGLFSDRNTFGGAPASDYRFGSGVDNSLAAGCASGPSFAASMRFTYCVRLAAAWTTSSISRIAARRILAGGFTIHGTA